MTERRKRVPFARFLFSVKNYVAEYRQNKNITQQELADWVGVSRQSIVSIETGRYNPSITLAHRLAVFFGLKIEDLFDFQDGPDALSDR